MYTVKNLTLMLSLLIVAVAISCKQEQPIEAPAEKEAEDAVQYFITTVDKLRARKKADSQSKVITKLAEGTILKDLKEESVTKETVTLRGVLHTQPYRKVETADGQELWVYGGGLAPYQMATVELREPKKLIALQNFIKTLPKGKIKSGNALLKQLLVLSADDPATNDALFLESMDYLNALGDQLSSAIQLDSLFTDDQLSDIFYRKFDMSKHRIGRQAEESGLRLDANEGMIYFVPDPIALDGAIGGLFTEGMKEYIQLLDEEYQHHLFSDAAIVADLKLLAEDAIAWSKFVARHSNFVHIDHAMRTADYLKLAVMRGTSNTPAFDYESFEVLDEFRSLWSQILENHDNFPFRQELKNHIEKLKSNDWKFER